MIVNVGDIRDAWEDIAIYSNGGNAEEGYEEFGFMSDLGEDFNFTLWYDDTAEGLVEAISDYAEDFDPEEHAVMWYEARDRVNGVPKSLSDLLKDAESIKIRLVGAAKLANCILNENNDAPDPSGVWYRQDELCPEDEALVTVRLKDGTEKQAIYHADEDGDVWLVEIPRDNISSWRYNNV